ncbi:MAG: FN3 associated domain-containing protein [Saprospiraceae bacterium]
MDQATVKISSLLPAHKIYFTLDGSEPNMQSKVYSGPVIIDKTCTLKTRAYTPDGKASRVVERTFRENATPACRQNREDGKRPTIQLL